MQRDAWFPFCLLLCGQLTFQTSILWFFLIQIQNVLFFQIRSGNNNISTNNTSTASANPNCQVETDNNIDICGEVLVKKVQETSICNTGTAGSLITRSDAGGGTTKRGRNSHATSLASTGHGCRRSTHEPTPSPTRKRNSLGSTVRSLFQSRNKDRLENFFLFFM